MPDKGASAQEPVNESQQFQEADTKKITTHTNTRKSALPQSVGHTDAYALHAAPRTTRRVRATGRAALFSSLSGPAFSGGVAV